MKICPMGGKLFHMDGQAGTTKPIISVHNFVNAQKTNGDVQL